MKRYFIKDGKNHGECLVDNPVNPDCLDIITYSGAVDVSIGAFWDGLTFINPPKSPDEIIAAKKAQRQIEVDAIKVTTHTGNTFDGDEISQGRMARAIIGMQTQPGITIAWVLANNVPAPVDASELTEALALAGMAQAAIWSAPYA